MPKKLSLAEIQQEELALLLAFDQYCRDNGLRYSLQAGTLIGAVRHTGFIPWDDDVDVSMPRPDYEQLIEKAESFPAPFALVGSWNSRFPYPFCKVVNREIRAQEPAYVDVLDEYLWIDIFPIDGVPNDADQLERSRKRINWLIKLRVMMTLNQDRVEQPAWKRLAKKACILAAGGHMDTAAIDAEIDKIAKSVPYESAERVASMLGGGYSGWTLPRLGYEGMVELEFEGHMFSAMGCWDEYLTKCYGSYMTLPPESERMAHRVEAWYMGGTTNACLRESYRHENRYS